MKIVLTGGGTLGSVSPLIAVWQTLNKRDVNLQALFIGTKFGPEIDFLKQYPALTYRAIPAGKLRRYFSLKNFFDLFLIIAGFFKALLILKRFKPQVIVSAGGFVAFPVILAGKLLGAKVIIHQLDFQPTLSNKLVQGLADKITVTFEKSLADFPKSKTVLVGSLVRTEAEALASVRQQKPNKNILILGGGTGALSLNQLIIDALDFLPDDLIINHVTGKNKKIEHQPKQNYYQFDLLTNDYYQKMAVADLVITRAGLSTLLELSRLGKPAIIIPLEKTHQEKNAAYFADKNAGIYLKQSSLTPGILADKINALLNNPSDLQKLSTNISNAVKHGGEEKIAEEIIKLC